MEVENEFSEHYKEHPMQFFTHIHKESYCIFNMYGGHVSRSLVTHIGGWHLCSVIPILAT
jgi:hypothetical protein